MRILLLCLVALVLLPVWSAPLPQPDAGDWEQLSRSANAVHDQYNRLIEEANRHIEIIRTNIKRDPEGEQSWKERLARIEQRKAEVVKALDEVKALITELVAYQRERNSGSQETMQELVMKGLTMAPPVEQIIGQGMGGPYNKLNHSSNGIGYTFYYYHTVQSPMNKVIVAVREGNPNAKPIPALKVISINYVLPTPETIRNRTYPYVTEVYAVTRKGTAAENPAIRVRDWLLTPEGQALVAESGYVAVAGK